LEGSFNVSLLIVYIVLSPLSWLSSWKWTKLSSMSLILGLKCTWRWCHSHRKYSRVCHVVINDCRKLRVKVPLNTDTKFKKKMPTVSELVSEDKEHMTFLKACLFLLQEWKHFEH
jgi:hypothetical protein